MRCPSNVRFGIDVRPAIRLISIELPEDTHIGEWLA